MFRCICFTMTTWQVVYVQVYLCHYDNIKGVYVDASVTCMLLCYYDNTIRSALTFNISPQMSKRKGLSISSILSLVVSFVSGTAVLYRCSLPCMRIHAGVYWPLVAGFKLDLAHL